MDHFRDLSLDWIFKPNLICVKIVQEAQIKILHLTEMEAKREIERMQKHQRRLYKEAKELNKN